MHVTSLQDTTNEAVFRNIHLSLPGQKWGQLKILVWYYSTLVGKLLIYWMVGFDWVDTRGLDGYYTCI